MGAYPRGSKDDMAAYPRGSKYDEAVKVVISSQSDHLPGLNHCDSVIE